MAPPALQALLSLLLAAWPTVASAAACAPGHYNASGSVNLPFPQPPTSSPYDHPGNYTLSTQLSFPSGPLGLNQSFRAINASGAGVYDEHFNYEGCFVVFGGSSWPATQGHINEADPSSCQSAFSSDCISETISNAGSIASAFSQQHLSAKWNCAQFTPPKCANAAEVFSSDIFTTAADWRSAGSFSNSSSNSSSSCPTGELFSVSGFAAGDKLSTYLKRLDSITPVMVIAWNNASSNPGGKPWSNVQFFCMSTNHLTPGSKSGASSTGSPRFGWYLSWLSSIICLLLFIM